MLKCICQKAVPNCTLLQNATVMTKCIVAERTVHFVVGIIFIANAIAILRLNFMETSGRISD